MRKYFIVMITTVLLSGLFLGCAKKTTTETNPNPQQQPAEQTTPENTTAS